MTCVEFAKTFNVYITFDSSGYGQMFEKTPKLIKGMDFFICNGNDAKLLPSLVEDYYEYSRCRKVIIISPETTQEDINKTISEGKKEMSNDLKKDDVVESNVEIVYSGTWPTPSGTEIHHIIAYDGSHHFVWDTRSTTPPQVGDKKFLKAVIKGTTDQTDYDIPAYSVNGVKLLLPKKE